MPSIPYSSIAGTLNVTLNSITVPSVGGTVSGILFSVSVPIVNGDYVFIIDGSGNCAGFILSAVSGNSATLTTKIAGSGSTIAAGATVIFTSASFSGDISEASATAGLITVVQLQGQPLSATTVTKGQFLMGSAAGTYGPISGSGDVSWSTGTAGLAAVVAIQGNTVTSGALTKGQLFIASSTTNWAATAPSGDVSWSSATAGLQTVTGLQGISVPSPSGTNTVLTYNSGAYTWAAGGGGVSYTIQPLYGTSNQTITITLNSLANSTVGVGRASTVIDNSTTLAEDCMISVTIASNASAGTSATGYVAVYMYMTTDGGTNYTESATGSDAGLTLTQPTNAPLLGIINVVANAKTYKFSVPSVCAVTGMPRLPQKFGIIAVNSSGATLAASGNSANYQFVNGKLV